MGTPNSACAGNKDAFKIISLQAFIEEKTTTIEENRDYLKYVTPKFKAAATVCVPRLQAGEEWQVGWIQACIHMKFINSYREGFSSWEFPELTSGAQSMISDSDGHFPWYGETEEVQTLRGPLNQSVSVSIQMEDNFFPRISWVIPIDHRRGPSLQRSERKQGFYTWLVARDLVKNTFFIMKTVYWEMTIDVDVDSSKALGSRAKLIALKRQTQPVVLLRNVPMTVDALRPPNANSAQILMYRSRDGRQEVVVKPAVASRIAGSRRRARSVSQRRISVMDQGQGTPNSKRPQFTESSAVRRIGSRGPG